MQGTSLVALCRFLMTSAACLTFERCAVMCDVLCSDGTSWRDRPTSACLANTSAPNRLGEVAGIVRGVSTPEDVLNGKLEEVSERAKQSGIRVGMTGAEALEVMKTLVPAAPKL